MDDSTIEALREVLQDMTSAIELLSSGERSGAALIHFIEEMLKTIESWAAKYNVFLEDGSLAANSAHGSHLNPEPHNQSNTNHQEEEGVDPMNLDQAVSGSLDTADLSASQHPIEAEAFQRSTVKPDQKLSTCAEKRGEHLMNLQNDSGGWQTIPSQMDHSSGITVSMGRRKTRSQAASMHADATPTGDREAEILLPQSEKGLNLLGNEPFESKGEVIESPGWLPEGWITKAKTKGTSSNVGSKNKVYVDPTSQHHFQSKKEVLAFVGTTKRKRGRPKKTESLKDFTPGNANDTALAASVHDSAVGNPEVQLPSNQSPSINMSSQVAAEVSAAGVDSTIAAVSAAGVDTAKRKRGRPRKADSIKNQPQTKDTNVSGDISESIVSSSAEAQVTPSILPTTNDTQPHASASSLPASTSSVPLPHQSGQPSEWLVYESLASLPFPMFEHLRYVENNANKQTTNSSPPTLWPWMLGNSEGLKKPFTDIKLSESKPIEEIKQEEAVPTSIPEETQAGEVVPKRPKKAARKNAS